MESKVESVDAEIAGQKLKVTGTNLNNLFTIASFVGICLIGTWLWSHAQESRDAQKTFAEAVREQTSAVKEQTVAAREQNCLIRFDQKDRQDRAEFCKQISR